MRGSEAGTAARLSASGAHYRERVVTPGSSRARPRSAERAPGRLVGLDVARCLALIGMVSAHVLPQRGPDGVITVVEGVVAGRSAALFAVLAGVSLALMTGTRTPVRGRERLARSAGIAMRALLIAAIGLALGALESGLAVILTYYGLLFLLGLAFVGFRARALLVLAAVWAIVVPVLSRLVRPGLPRFTYVNPQPDGLSDPTRLLGELLLTGYYPVLPWMAYLLAGMGLGRLDLTHRRTQAMTALVGAALAAVAILVSRLITAQDRVVRALLLTDERSADSGSELLDQIATGMYGNIPRDGQWEWLLVVAPHSSTPFDLLATIGTSLLVIGGCLLLVGALDPVWTRRVAVAFGAGTMTLSLYTLHVVMRTPGVPPAEVPGSYIWHVLVLLAIGAGFVAARRRGPLEWLVATLSARMAALVRDGPR
jgi:uncharacterized membrane protein